MTRLRHRALAIWRQLREGLRTIITGDISVAPPADDPYITWLRDQEQLAEQATARRRQNFIEAELQRGHKS